MEEEDEIQAQACNKLQRIGSCNNNKNEEEDEEDGGGVRIVNNSWNNNNNSRIIRVSRATGGKDRHSKVMTSKGLRDRRVRLSVSTAIQFYDLQDRLGYDQPSKAVEWLIKAASDSISELPPLSTTFPETPKQQSDHEKRHHQGFLFDHHHQQNNNHQRGENICSSNSETSRSGGSAGAGVGLSLSKSENRVKARERARKRTAKEKDHNEISLSNVNPNVSQTASFTELLTGGIGAARQQQQQQQQQEHQHWSSTVTPIMDYFSSSLPQVSVAFSSGEMNHSDPQMLQQFSFMHQHLVTSSTPSPVCGEEYSLSFNNRGTLQSNISSSQYHPSLLPHHHDLHHHQRFSSTMDGSSSNMPSFFMGGGGANPVSSSAPALDNNHHPQQHNNNQFSSAVFDGRLQLCYGEGSRHSDHKGKGKN